MISLYRPIQRLFSKGSGRSFMVMLAAWAVQFGCSLLGSVITARYLGVAKFGTLSYTLTLFAFAGAIARLGLGDIVARELVKGDKPIGELIGTALYMRIAAGAVALFCVAAFGMYFETDSEIQLLLLLGAGILLFDGPLAFEYLMQAKQAFGLTSRARMSNALGGLAMRAGLVMTALPLAAFVLVQYAEAVWYLFLFGWVTRHMLKGVEPKWNAAVASHYFRQGLPIMLASLAVVVYNRIDQIMIKHWLGSADLGIYAVTARLAEAANFLPGILGLILFPKIVQLRAEEGSAAHKNKLVLDFFSFMYVAGIAYAVVISMLAAPLVKVLYGVEYAAASSILSIYVWSTVFVFLGMASQTYLLAESGTTQVVLVRTIVGAIANIVLNALLIPRYGLYGAAWATVCSYAIATYFFYDRGRSFPLVRYMLIAANPIRWITMFKELFQGEQRSA